MAPPAVLKEIKSLRGWERSAPGEERASRCWVVSMEGQTK